MFGHREQAIGTDLAIVSFCSSMLTCPRGMRRSWKQSQSARRQQRAWGRMRKIQVAAARRCAAPQSHTALWLMSMNASRCPSAQERPMGPGATRQSLARGPPQLAEHRGLARTRHSASDPKRGHLVLATRARLSQPGPSTCILSCCGVLRCWAAPRICRDELHREILAELAWGVPPGWGTSG